MKSPQEENKAWDGVWCYTHNEFIPAKDIGKPRHDDCDCTGDPSAIKYELGLMKPGVSEGEIQEVLNIDANMKHDYERLRKQNTVSEGSSPTFREQAQSVLDQNFGAMLAFNIPQALDQLEELAREWVIAELELLLKYEADPHAEAGAAPKEENMMVPAHSIRTILTTLRAKDTK